MKRAFFLYFVIESVIIVGCGRDECAFDNSVASVGNVNARNIYYYSYDNIELLKNNDTVKYSNFAIWLDVDPEYILQTRKSSRGNQLYACDHITPLLEEQIVKMTVTSLIDFRDDISKGTDLSEFFDFMTESGRNSINEEKMNEYFQREFYLFLKSSLPVDQDRFVQFMIRLEMNNGDIYEVDTEKIFLISPDS